MSPLPRVAKWLVFVSASLAGGCTETIPVEPVSPVDSSVARRALDLGPGTAQGEPADGEAPAVDGALDGDSDGANDGANDGGIDTADASPDAAVDGGAVDGQNGG